jgi:hypothetical protein
MVFTVLYLCALILCLHQQDPNLQYAYNNTGLRISEVLIAESI